MSDFKKSFMHTCGEPLGTYRIITFEIADPSAWIYQIIVSRIQNGSREEDPYIPRATKLILISVSQATVRKSLFRVARFTDSENVNFEI
jgi:hypothetical protein